MAIGILALVFAALGAVVCLLGIGKSEKPPAEEKERVYPTLIEL